MAIKTPAQIKARFETGDTPTQQDFIDLVDSVHNDNITGVVRTTGNETIAGIKTFLSPLVMPDASNANEAATKGQMDAADTDLQDQIDALSSLVNANVSEVQIVNALPTPTVPSTLYVIAGVTHRIAVTDATNTIIYQHAPTMAELATKEDAISPGTTGQYFSSDKSWQDLDKAAVGLGNVDNTSDLNKPISTATQTALNTKQTASQVNALISAALDALPSNNRRIAYNHQINGVRDGSNQTFTVEFVFDPNTIAVYRAGDRQTRGGAYDFEVLPDNDGVQFTRPVLPEENLIIEAIEIP